MIIKKNRNELKKKNYLMISVGNDYVNYERKKKNYIKFSNRFITKTLKKKITNFKLNFFFNQYFDKKRLKIFVFWCFQTYGQNQTIKVLEILKSLGFQHATKAGLSLSIDDLIIPATKSKLLIDAELSTRTAMIQYKNAQITNLERFQKIIETWHLTSEKMKDDMIHHFKTINIFNPLYMMAFSGARGNISQVRQLVGMRGLMANPQGQILDFPIRSNFREGLTLTEYVISCYGARKGVVDTALRTANAGYLTRRLVDVAQHIIISNFDCKTKRGLIVSEMKQGNRLLFSLRQRLLGRVLAKNVFSGNFLIARKNQEISDNLSEIIASLVKTVIIRSPLTCKTTQFICQRCYGWSLAEGKLVGVGETVGIIAAQSIGEPGTQLTMRTFHTGGVFAGELLDQLIAPFDALIKYNIYIPGNLIRTSQGTIAFLTRIESELILQRFSNSNKKKHYTIPPYTILFVRNGETVSKNQLIAQLCTFSPSFKNSSNLIEYKIYSDLEGEIKSTNLKIIKKVTEMNDIMYQSLEWGYIWILSGRIYELPFNSINVLKFKANLQQKNNFFPVQGDFLAKSSILSQILWINNTENIKLSFEKKTDFYQKFKNNKKLSIKHCNEKNNKWLQKWVMFSEIYCFTNLNKSIKKFKKNLEFFFKHSFINVYSQNLLCFLTIDKIRYRKMGYFLFFKQHNKKISLKNLNLLKKIKYRAKKKENKNILVNWSFTQKNNNKARWNNKNKIFLSIPLEYNTNEQSYFLTPPRFFYQKLSNMFFEWFPNEQNFIGSGLINFSEICILKKKIKKGRKKKHESGLTGISTQNGMFLSTFQSMNKKTIVYSKKKQQHYDNYPFGNNFKLHFIKQNILFLKFVNHNNKLKYLNNNYSIIIILFRPFNQCQKQKLSQFHLKTKKYFNCFSSLIKSILIKSIILILRKKQKGIQESFQYNESINFQIVFDIKNQLRTSKRVQKENKYNTKKPINFNLYLKKKRIIKSKQKNKLEVINIIEFQISSKYQKDNFYQTDQKNGALLKTRNKINKSKKYLSLNPISFCNKRLKNNNSLLNKKFYYKLQYNNNQNHNFFTMLSNNYLTKNLYFYIKTNENKNFVNKRKFLFIKNFSNIFIRFYNRTYNQSFLFSYTLIRNRFFYKNMNKIFNKQKLLIFQEFYSKNHFDKLKEIKDIQNFKKFYSSFTYYMIKNQFRFAPVFQAQSINQLENIYKKEIKNFSNYKKSTQKLLFIKQLDKTHLASFVKKKKRTWNISKKNYNILNIINIVSLHFDYENILKKYNFQKLINQIKKYKGKAKKTFKKNKKSSKYLIVHNNYLHFLFKQLIKFSNYIFNKTKHKYFFLNYDYKQKNTEKLQYKNDDITIPINCKKSFPILLIKYEKKNITLNSLSYNSISIVQHFFIHKQIKVQNKKHNIVIFDTYSFINNKINNYILNIYLIKLNSLSNLVINSYFQLVSFKWLLIGSKASLIKKKKLNPIFFKRLYFSTFINKNIIISEKKCNQSVLALKRHIKNNNNKKKTFNKNTKNKVLNRSEEKLLLYGRFSLLSKQYGNVSKNTFSIFIFNPQQKMFDNNFKIFIKSKICFLSHFNNLSLLQKYLLFINKFSLDKFKLKKPITERGVRTLKNFLNIKKKYNNREKLNINFLSKRNYLQKTNQFIFYLFDTFFNNQLEIFKNNRQCQLILLNLKNPYGIFKLKKQNKKNSLFESSEEKLFKSINRVYLSKQSTILLTKKGRLFHNKKELKITNQPGWICKPIKNKNIVTDYLKISSSNALNGISDLLEMKFKFADSKYSQSFHSINISYQFCEKKLTWLNSTFLKMIELVKNFCKNSEKNFSIFYLSFLTSRVNFVIFKQHSEFLKNQKENLTKTNHYDWLVNKKTRFLKMKEYNIDIFHIKNYYKIKKGINETSIEKIFCIVKRQEFIMNNYQNLAYFSSTNILFLSRKKLFKLFEKRHQPNNWWNNDGFILKSQYHSIILNKQKLSQKLISKFPNLEITFEQHLNIPSNKLTNISYNKKNNYRINLKLKLKQENKILSKNNKNFHYLFISKDIQRKNLEINNRTLNNNHLKIINKNPNFLKFQKSVKIFHYFLGFVIPIHFDFSFQSSNISWNFFPDSNLPNLNFDKKIKSIDFLTYLIFKNEKKIELNIRPNRKLKQGNLAPSTNTKSKAGIFVNLSNCLKMLLRQPCIDWSATQFLNMGYNKNNFLAPTKTLFLLSPQNSFSNDHPIALTKIYSGMKGEILYSFQTNCFDLLKNNGIESKITNNVSLTNSFLKLKYSLFLTKSDQICLKFRNERILNKIKDERSKFIKKLKIFHTHKHIRSLKIFQIKSVKQIILIFKILQKIHNNCQFSNQSIKINLGLFLFQGDLLKTFFINPPYTRINKKKIKSIIVNHSGQIIHLNEYKLTLRKGQPIFFSPHCIFHSYNNDFIQKNKPVLSLPYQQLKTGDIVQGIPKIEQLFEARLTFAGKLEYDNLTNILEILFETYKNKLQLKLAVRRSIELIQMIIINSIQRIYRSQGVNISDKHLEIIVKQMTKKVEIIDSGQSGFLIGEHFDLDVVELWNSKLSKIKHVKYKPLILGISKASLQTDSFLSAASFQYTTRILSQAAFFKKRDFLKGLKENIIVGNIIPAGTGYLGNIENLFKIN